MHNAFLHIILTASCYWRQESVFLLQHL